MIFFVLLQVRVYENYRTGQRTNPKLPTYCSFTIFTSALGLVAADYLAILLFFATVLVLLLGIGIPKE